MGECGHRYVRRDLWRDRAIEIRVMFEKNKNVKDPRAVARLLREAEGEVGRLSHPDPYRRESCCPCCVTRMSRMKRTKTLEAMEGNGESRMELIRSWCSVALPGRNQMVRTFSLVACTYGMLIRVVRLLRERNLPVSPTMLIRRRRFSNDVG